MTSNQGGGEMEKTGHINQALQGMADQKQRLDDCCAAMRPLAKDLMRERAKALRMQADEMDRLCEQLPEKMTPAADKALWRLLVSQR